MMFSIRRSRLQERRADMDERICVQEGWLQDLTLNIEEEQTRSFPKQELLRELRSQAQWTDISLVLLKSELRDSDAALNVLAREQDVLDEGRKTFEQEKHPSEQT
jgi:hypothetical protein